MLDHSVDGINKSALDKLLYDKDELDKVKNKFFNSCSLLFCCAPLNAGDNCKIFKSKSTKDFVSAQINQCL